jgi:hypothetical protein
MPPYVGNRRGEYQVNAGDGTNQSIAHWPTFRTTPKSGGCILSFSGCDAICLAVLGIIKSRLKALLPCLLEDLQEIVC